jgi:hypothetical protein
LNLLAALTDVEIPADEVSHDVAWGPVAEGLEKGFGGQARYQLNEIKIGLFELLKLIGLWHSRVLRGREAPRFVGSTMAARIIRPESKFFKCGSDADAVKNVV